MTATPSPLVTKVCRVLRGGWETPWSAAHVAGLADVELDTVRKICARLAKVGVLARVGKLYQWVQGAEIPADGRGRHGNHRCPSGPAWAKRRKQKANLQKARHRKQVKAAVDAQLGPAGLISGRWV